MPRPEPEPGKICGFDWIEWFVLANYLLFQAAHAIGAGDFDRAEELIAEGRVASDLGARAFAEGQAHGARAA